MRVLLDECIPKQFRRLLPNHLVFTAAQRGWSGLRNGALLSRISGNLDAFVTVDRNLKYQQKLDDLPFGIVIIQARSNKLRDLSPFALQVLEALEALSPGQVKIIERA